jgi:hypothetical protein
MTSGSRISLRVKCFEQPLKSGGVESARAKRWHGAKAGGVRSHLNNGHKIRKSRVKKHDRFADPLLWNVAMPAIAGTLM